MGRIMRIQTVVGITIATVYVAEERNIILMKVGKRS